MSVSIKSVRKHYRTLSDARIREIVEGESSTLTNDGLMVLKEEITKRNLPLLKTINNKLQEKEDITSLIEERCRIIRDQPCPICGSEEYKLNAVELSKVRLGLKSTEFNLGCYDCLVKKNSETTDGYSILNLFSLWGLVSGNESIKHNTRQIEQLKVDQPTPELWKYAEQLERAVYREAMQQININPISDNDSKELNRPT